MEAEVQAWEGRAVIHLLFLSRCLVGNGITQLWKLNSSRGCCLQSGYSGKPVLCLPVVLRDLSSSRRQVFSPGHQADSPAFPSFWALFGPSVCWVALLMKERAMCFGWSSVWRLMSWESLLCTEDMSSRHQHPLTQLVPTYFRSMLLTLCLPSLLLASLDNDSGLTQLFLGWLCHSLWFWLASGLLLLSLFCITFLLSWFHSYFLGVKGTSLVTSLQKHGLCFLP